jgi:hypothetical protein
MAQSRVEAIIESKINGTEYKSAPLSRIEELLINTDFGGNGGLTGDVNEVVINQLNKLQEHALLDSELESD